MHYVLAALFPMVHFTENHETIQLQLQQGQLLDVHALGSDFVLHQGTQNVCLSSIVLIAIVKELITVKHN
jgi:hypothetical protein